MPESNEPDPSLSAPEPRLPAETMERYMEVQERELAVKSRELEVRMAEIEHNANYAHAALEAQVVDRENDRAAQDRTGKRNLYVVAGVVVLLIASGTTLAVLGKETILVELIKLAVVFVGGYQGGRYAERKRKDNQE